MNSQSSANVNALLKSAQDDGAISASSMHALQVVDVGRQINNALGVSIDTVAASEAIILTQLIDDSGSIRFVSGNSQAVRDGHNLVIEALKKSKQVNNVLAHTTYLNGKILFPFIPIDQAVLMETSNYDPNGGTPLYDQTMVVLGTVLVKAQECLDNGLPVRTITLIITDGNDEHSVGATPATVSALVGDLLRQERHIIAAMGIDDGSTDFRLVFQSMGIPDQWILTPGNTPSEIRKAFRVFSQSAVRASQSAASFSKTALGGFVNP